MAEMLSVFCRVCSPGAAGQLHGTKTKTLTDDWGGLNAFQQVEAVLLRRVNTAQRGGVPGCVLTDV